MTKIAHLVYGDEATPEKRAARAKVTALCGKTVRLKPVEPDPKAVCVACHEASRAPAPWGMSVSFVREFPYTTKWGDGADD